MPGLRKGARDGEAMRTLIADQTPALVDLRTGLEAGGHEVRRAADGIEALRLARAWTPDLVIARVDLARMDGLALVAALRALGCAEPWGLALAGPEDDLHTRARARQLGVGTYLPFPVEGAALAGVLRRAELAGRQGPAPRTRAERRRRSG
jgi:DNA-binding response OmpR family regulator